VFRRTNAGNTEINIPKNIVTKGRAKAWLKANPNKVKNPTSYKAKRSPLKGVQAPGMRRFERIINGKKMIAFVNKNGKPYYRPAPIGNPVVSSSNINFKCDTTFFKKVRASNGATGYKATILANRNKLYTMVNSRIPVTKGMGKLGKGSQGVVFLAYTSPKGTYPVTIKVTPHDKTIKKQTADIEFDIQKKLYSIVPGNISQPYKLIHGCKTFVPTSTWTVNNKNTSLFDYSDQTVIFTEYITGGSLSDWMVRMNSRLSDAFMQNLISQVLHMLLFIGKRLPSFRHNDLHLDNILVKQNSFTKFPIFVLNDFGWASMGAGSNPLVNGAKHAGKFGIGPKTSSRYDMHLFLNEMHKWMEVHGGRSKYPKALAFIEKHLPAGYIGSNSTYISESRLKYGIPYPGLSGLTDIVKDPYVLSPKKFIQNIMNTGEIKRKQDAIFKSTKNIEKLHNNMTTTPRTRAIIKKLMNSRRNNPVVSPNSVKTPANNGGSKRPKTSSRKKAGKAVSRNRTSPKKLKFSPYKNMKLSPRSFLKLTPRSRAAYMVKARGNTSTRGVLVKNVAKTRGAPVERETFRMVPVPRTYMKMNGPGRNTRTVAKNSPARWAARKIVNEAIRKAIAANRKPSPPKPLRLRTPTPPRNSPRKPPTPVSPRLASMMERSKKANRRSKYRTSYTPKTGRMKIEGNKGRLSYVNGTGVSMSYLKNIATKYGVNITGLRSKVSIANKIFRNNK
jgi:hypothetical protein